MDFKDIAHEYQLAGLQVIPTYNKAPSNVANTNYLYEEKGSDFIDQYFDGVTQMGVVCGQVSGNLTCFDFDQHLDGQDVTGVFDQFVLNPVVKHLIDTKQAAVYSSPSGGRHIFVRTPETEKPKLLSKYKTGDVMIELRGQGQYMVCWPSPGYTHIGGVELMMVNEIDDEAFLHMVELAISFSEVPIEEENKTESDRKWGETWNLNTPDGKYNIEEGGSAYRLLLEKGWTEVVERRRGDLRYLTRPGKDSRDGISATWGYRPNMLYVFSQSVPDFPIPSQNIGKAFSPFDILVRYEYDGDWRKAKDALREVYGMEKKIKVKAPILTTTEEEEVKRDPFPIEVFPDEIQNFILQLKQTLNFSPDILACSIISAISSLVGNSVKVQVKEGYVTAMIFWFMIRGRAGTSKTHPVDNIMKPLKSINKVGFDNYQRMLKDYNALSEEEKNRTDRPVFKQVLVDDATVESFRKILTYNPRGVLLHNDEIKKFIKGMNRYQGKDTGEEAFWLSSFNNSSFTVNRVKDDPVVINSTFINIIGTIQNDVLDDILVKSQESGFIDRFLFSRSEKLAHKLTNAQMDKATLRWWDEYLVTMHVRFEYDGENSRIVKFSNNGFAKLMEVDSHFVDLSNEENTTEKTRSYIAKIRTYIPRLALFFCIVDRFDMRSFEINLSIEPTHVERAYLIANYFYNTGMEVFDENMQSIEMNNVDKMQGQTNAERVVNMLEKGYNQKQISDRLKCSKSYISKLVKQLKESGSI